MSDAKILILMPTRGAPDHLSMLSVLNASKVAGAKRIYCQLEMCGGQTAPIARNMGVRKMLDGDFTHIFFVDDDTVIPQDSIIKLLALESDAATGMTPVCCDGRFRLNVHEKGTDDCWPPPWPVGVFDVDQCGTSCLLVRRNVFEDMELPWFQYNQDCARDPFDVTTEDVYFTRKVTDAGFRIRCDASVICDHIHKLGMLTFMPPPPGMRNVP